MLIGLCMWLLTITTYIDDLPSLEEYDFSEIQSFLEEELPDTKLNFAEIVTELMSGDSESIVSTGLEWGYQLLFSEIEANRTILLNVILIAVIGAVFTNFSSVFRNSDISETGFFITYLLMIGLPAGFFSVQYGSSTPGRPPHSRYQYSPRRSRWRSCSAWTKAPPVRRSWRRSLRW